MAEEPVGRMIETGLSRRVRIQLIWAWVAVEESAGVEDGVNLEPPRFLLQVRDMCGSYRGCRLAPPIFLASRRSGSSLENSP